MLARLPHFFALIFGTSLSLAAPSEPLTLAAEYYFSRYEYRQAFTLWGTVLKRQPDNLPALLRFAELKLLFEGRPASRDLLLEALNTRSSLSYENRRQVRDKLVVLQSLFLTEEGQTAYLQALSRVKAKDWAGALNLLNSAAALEKGNLVVLREKAKSEKALQLSDAYYQSLKSSYEGNPYDSDTLESLLEAHDYYAQFEKTVAAYRRETELPRTVRQKLAYGVALAELKSPEALNLLQALVESEKQSGLHPIVWYEIGQLLSVRPDRLPESVNYLERFISAVGRPENLLIDGWDPFRAQEKAEGATKLLAKLKARINEG